MKLYIHIGTEKTGSSFLQTYFARNRDLLKKHSICYPHAGVQETKMKKGLITPGNASDLEKLLLNQEWYRVSLWLAQKKKEAENQNCSALLLSNEILILRFAVENVLAKFLEILMQLEIKCEGLLLMIREPVSQALSLYKHRSKEGVLYPIEEWLNQKYFIANALENFYKQISLTRLSLFQYPYRKDSQYLVEVCVNQWLKLDEEIKVEHTSVNPSLTLSELVLLCEIFNYDKILAKRYYNFMIKIDAKNKSDDKFYKTYVKNHVNNFMVNYNPLWNKVNKHMSVKADVFTYSPIEVDENNKFTSFSEIQMQQISAFIDYAKSLKYYKYKTIRKIRKALVKVTPRSVIEYRKKVLYS